MEKRTSKRINKNVAVRFPCCESLNSGTVTNISEKGMFINTVMCFPIQSRFEISVFFKNEILKIPVKIVRLVKIGNIYKGMGIELLNLPKKYLEFLIELNFACEV